MFTREVALDGAGTVGGLIYDLTQSDEIICQAIGLLMAVILFAAYVPIAIIALLMRTVNEITQKTKKIFAKN